MNPFYQLLRSDGSIVVNKALVHSIGLNEAIMYSELLSKFAYFEERGQLENGMFFNTAENLERDTGLKRKQQKKAIDNLVSFGLVSVNVKGIPARKYFKINDNIQILAKLLAEGKYFQQLGKKCRTSTDDIATLDKQNVPCNNTKNNIKNNTKEYIALTSDDARVSFFLAAFIDYTKREHPKVTNVTYDEIMDRLDYWDDIDYEEWCDTVIEYFQHGYNMPHLNHFLSMAFRLFNTGGSYDY